MFIQTENIKKEKYMVEYKYYHQREYHTSFRFFKTKKEFNEFIKRYSVNDKLIISKHKIEFKRMK